MRIPTSKLYRAFPELDQFSDAQCELLMRRVRLNERSRIMVGVLPVVVALSWLVAACAMLRAGLLELGHVRPLLPGVRDADLLAAFVFCLVPAAGGALFVRDALLRRYLTHAIRLRVDRVRCPRCRYVLIGQREIEGSVACPECGLRVWLRQLGITAADLIPPESAEPLGRTMSPGAEA